MNDEKILAQSKNLAAFVYGEKSMAGLSKDEFWDSLPEPIKLHLWKFVKEFPSRDLLWVDAAEGN